MLKSAVFLLFLFPITVPIFYDSGLYVPKWSRFLDHQERLTKDLFANYDSTISPVYTSVDSKKPIGYDPEGPGRWNYSILLYYLKLVQVQEPEEKISVVLELMEGWYDPRLAWNSSEYGNITSFVARQDRVWSPTLTAFGVNEIIDFRDPDFRIISVDMEGGLSDYLSVRVSANCRMDMATFPFDSQTCQICFCLPLFNRVQVEITGEIYKGIQDALTIKHMGNSEWQVINLTNSNEVVKYADNFGSMDLAIFTITIRRNPLYYMYMIVFPSFIINVISIIGVFLKNADKMSKLNVGLTNIMTMTFILGVMADKIPRTGSIPLLGIYIIVNLGIMILAIGIVSIITEVRQWALPKLKRNKGSFSRKLETFLDTPVEYTCAIILELLTTANFFVMVGFWFDDI